MNAIKDKCAVIVHHTKEATETSDLLWNGIIHNSLGPILQKWKTMFDDLMAERTVFGLTNIALLGFVAIPNCSRR